MGRWKTIWHAGRDGLVGGFLLIFWKVQGSSTKVLKAQGSLVNWIELNDWVFECEKSGLKQENHRTEDLKIPKTLYVR